jgi:hypothetical protein
MDANKLAKLNEIHYSIPRTCGFCKHSSIPAPTGEWGECTKYTYEHQKHNEAKRFLSIYRGGTCDGFELNNDAIQTIGRFMEFMQ